MFLSAAPHLRLSAVASLEPFQLSMRTSTARQTQKGTWHWFCPLRVVIGMNPCTRKPYPATRFSVQDPGVPRCRHETRESVWAVHRKSTEARQATQMGGAPRTSLCATHRSTNFHMCPNMAATPAQVPHTKRQGDGRAKTLTHAL